MSPRPAADPVKAVAAEATPIPAVTVKPAASLPLLGGDEIIQLSIRPSPWCIALYSFKLLLAMALLATAVGFATQGRPSLPASVALAIIVLAAFGGLIATTLQWASQLYVLTNRRVLRFRGVFNVDVAQCGLAQIGSARLYAAWYERLGRLGSIEIVPNHPDARGMVWEHVARPTEVHEILVRAIQKSKSGA